MEQNERARATRGLITDIQRFSIHDGPGIRTTVFLKGCPLRCYWCHNPETWAGKTEIMFSEERCMGCGACSKAYPGVMQTGGEGRREFRREYCGDIYRCAAECSYGALTLTGKWWEADELYKELAADIPYYRNSGGGITLSGGEPLVQSGFCIKVLELCKEAGLHTAIETSGFCGWEELEGFLPLLDMVIMDIKHMDDAMHKEATGVSNRIILENARRLDEAAMPLLMRTPVIPGFNDTAEAIGAVAEYIRDFKHLMNYELMPFHNMGKSKYRSLGLVYKAETLTGPTEELIKALNALTPR